MLQIGRSTVNITPYSSIHRLIKSFILVSTLVDSQQRSVVTDDDGLASMVDPTDSGELCSRPLP